MLIEHSKVESSLVPRPGNTLDSSLVCYNVRSGYETRLSLYFDGSIENGPCRIECEKSSRHRAEFGNKTFWTWIENS